MAALSHQIQTGPTQEVSVQTNSQQSFGSNNAQTAQLTSFSTGSSIVTTMASEGLSTLVACTKDDPRPQSVHVLQSNLQSLVGVITKVDGWYGNQTTTAVTKFLASRGQNGSGSSVSTTLAAQIDQAMAQKQEAQRIASSVYLSMVQRGVTTLFPVSSKPPQPDSIVQKVQEFLKGQGLYKFGADGWYGARTAEAVKKYQEDVIGVGTGNIDISTAQLIDFARNVSTEPAAGSNQTGNQNSTGNAQGSSQGSSNTASPVTGPKTETSKNWMSMPLLSQMTADGISRLSPVGQYHYGNAEAPDSVWIAQKVLKDKEYGVSKVDGWYGNQTGRAVEAIRRAYNLPVGASVRNVLDAQVAQVIDFIRGMAPPLQQGNQAGNTTGSSENASNSGGSGNSSSTVGQSTGTAEILNEIAYLQTRLSSGNSTTLQQYNVYYNSDNSATSDHDGTYLKNHMLGHGIKKLMPEANDVGVDDIQRFVQEGHLDAPGVTDSDREMFLRAISQLGSFYGNNNGPDNHLNYLPSSVQNYQSFNKFAEQTDLNVGKWDCSAYAAYVQGKNSAAGVISSQIVGVQGQAMTGTPISQGWSNEQFRQNIPMGTALAYNEIKTRSDGTTYRAGHVVMVLGYYNNGDALISQAEGSNTFLNAKPQSISNLKQKFTHYLQS